MKRSNLKVMPRGRTDELELELYKRIFKSAKDAIAVVDPDGYYLEQNPAHQELIGYSDSELHGQTPAIHLGEEQFALVTDELARTGEYHGDLRSRTRDGQQLTIELSAFTMRNASGHVLCHVGVKRDVTEQRRAAHELQARVKQQAVVARLGQQALAGMELGTLMQDAVASVGTTLGSEYCKVVEVLPDGKLFRLRAAVGWTAAPPAAGATLACDPDTQAGYTLQSSVPVVVEDLTAERRFSSAALLRQHEVASGMSVIIPVRGRPWGVLAAHSKQRRRFTADDVNFLVAVANVIAAAIERSQAEEALRQSEQRFRRVQQSANLGTYEWDVKTNTVIWSEQLPVLRGLAPDGKLNSWLRHVHPEDRARVIQAMEQALRDGNEFDIEARLVSRANDVIWVVSRGQAVYENGRPHRVVGIIFDVTARKQAEELLQRSEKLAMIGRLAASIAHEINNPLEAVTNLLYLIEHHARLDDTLRRYARMASEELARVAHISRQTLGFYRESSTAVPVYLPELLDDVIRLYSRKLDRKRIRVHRDYRVAHPVPIYPAEIRQVFSNLLMNALEASPDGDAITIRLEQATEWGRPEQHGVRIVVADQGHGIAPQNRHKIFEPFFTTKGEKGTGLGLWVSNGLVQKHGGSIQLRSSTNPKRHGTVFAVFIPDADAALHAPTRSAHQAAATE